MERHVNQVPAVVADDLGVPVEAVMVEDGAVFYDSGKGLRCACQVGTAYWHECAVPRRKRPL